MTFKNRSKAIAKIPKKNLRNLKVGYEGIEDPFALSKPRKKRELHWRKHKHNNISWLKNKRVKIVENTKKEQYTISGLNKSELEKIREVL